MGNRSPCEFWGKGLVTGLRPDPLQEESGRWRPGKGELGRVRDGATAQPDGGGLCRGGVPRVGPSSRDEAAGGTLGLLLGEVARGGSGGERGQVDLAPVCLPVTALHPDRLPRVMATTSHGLQGSYELSIPSSTSGSQGRGAGKGASTLAEFAKGQTTTLEGKGCWRCAE